MAAPARARRRRVGDGGATRGTGDGDARGRRGSARGGLPGVGVPRERDRDGPRGRRAAGRRGLRAARSGARARRLPPGRGRLTRAAPPRRPLRRRRARGGGAAEGAVRPRARDQPRALDGGAVSVLRRRVAERPPLRFVGPDVPALADLQNCIHCGFCLPSCPTYIATGQELESPRGRLHLISAVTSGRVEASDRLLAHLDLCLQCRACETACPSAVPYGRIMEDARASIMANPFRRRPRSWQARALVLRWVLARPRVLRAAFALARLYVRSGAQRLVR
ncbi:MAG: 4Fe-4S dicluster domain-containing protein, partial [Chloroflexi bacterium]|nr:4Fe-4S dicluster domain-containing protein [Chloroflexota bacterium]